MPRVSSAKQTPTGRLVPLALPALRVDVTYCQHTNEPELRLLMSRGP